MNKLLFLLTVLFLCTSAFIKKEDAPAQIANINEITIDSALQFKCDMEGDNLHYVKKRFHYIENHDSAKSLSSKLWIYDDDYNDTCHLLYRAGFCYANSKEGFNFTRGFLVSILGQKPAEVSFISLFVMGKYAFEERKSELEYMDIEGNKWTTTEGDQTGSNFEIVDYLSTGDRDKRACKVLVKFNCKLYNKKFTSKFLIIKNGNAVLAFAH
jgi:hypothetical protein